MKGDALYIDSKTAIDFLIGRHYSPRKPQITKAFGWFPKGDLAAVCTFGKPASPNLCIGVAGKDNSKYVYELNRLCRKDSLEDNLSSFVSCCLRMLKLESWIIVSYADTAMNHHGYIYQACNFLYTGATKKRTDKYTSDGKHSRHYDKNQDDSVRKVRSSKHRYIYFATRDKRLKKRWLKELNYDIKPYPKGDNKNYQKGFTIKDELIINDLKGEQR